MELYSDYIIESAARGGIGRNILLKPGKSGTQAEDYYDLSTEDGIQEYINDSQASATSAVQTSGQELDKKGAVTIEELEQRQKNTLRTQRAAFRDAMSNVYNNNYVNQKMNEFDNAVKDGTLSKFLNDTRADLDPMTVKNSEYAKPKLNTEVAANQSLNMVNDVDEGMMTYIATQPYIDNAKTNLDGGFQRILNAMKDDESRTFVVETGILADNRYMVWDKGKWQWKHRTWRTPLETFYTDERS